MIELDNATFREFINDDFVLVEFYTDYCPHCSTLTVMLESLCEENDIRGGKIDVSKFKEIREEFEIELVPTVIAFSKGESIGGFMGLINPGTAKKELLRLASSINN